MDKSSHIQWRPIEEARRDGTRYLFYDPKTPMGTYTGSWKLRWGIIDGQKVMKEDWWLDGFDSPSNPVSFCPIPMI